MVTDTLLKDRIHFPRCSHISLASVCAYIIIPIETIPPTGSDQQDRINRRSRETFWNDTLGSLEPTSINKKRAETVLGSAEANNTVNLVMPFSKTGRLSSKILLKRHKLLETKRKTITAYTKHKNLPDTLLSKN